MKYNLRDIIKFISDKLPSINEIYIFGSRSYGTKSIRSDIDLLAISEKFINPNEINEALHEKYPAIDLFITDDNKCELARSVTNGSYVKKRAKKLLVEQLDAKILWKKQGNEFFNEIFLYQDIIKGREYKMSIVNSPSMDFIDLNNRVIDLKERGIDTFFSGSNWDEISNNVIKIIENSFNLPNRFSKKAKQISFDTLKIKDEYDFQNWIHILLRPIFPTITPEPFTINFNGSSKNADFSISNNNIIIEAKYIKDQNTKSNVENVISGLKDFYMKNPNVNILIFLVLYNPRVKIDNLKSEADFNLLINDSRVKIKYIKNTMSE